MARLLALATLVLLLAGCTALHGNNADDDEDTASNNAAAFLGYHGPVNEMGGPPAPAPVPARELPRSPQREPAR